MDTMYMTARYLGMHARRLGRAIFRNDAGALTLEWIVIAGFLVVAAGLAYGFFHSAIMAAVKKLK